MGVQVSGHDCPVCGFDPGRRIRVNSAFIAEYKTAHQEMLEALRVMDEMALGPVPYQLRFGSHPAEGYARRQ